VPEVVEAQFDHTLAKVEDLERGIIKATEKERKEWNTGPDILTWQTAGVGRFLDQDPPERLFLFDGLIPRRTVGGIFAAGGVGKSFLLIQLALALATKIIRAFQPTDRFRTLYIGAEDSEEELHRTDLGHYQTNRPLGGSRD
jgi:predicted ATP-dependent serine protease